MARGKHEEVLETLRGKILRGECAVRFPSERMLCKQFGVTRDAIRKVLAQLESQRVITRQRGSGTYLAERARNRASGIFGIIMPDMKTPFYAAMVEGISKSLKNPGGGVEYVPLISDLGTGSAVHLNVERLARLCVEERVVGVFFRPLSSTAGRKATEKVLALFREAKIPVVLIDGDATKLPEGTGCDLVGAKGYRSPTAEIAALLGDIAFRLMLQRLTYPSHPPAEVLLDPPYGAK